MHGRHLEHSTLGVANGDGLRAIFNDAGSKSIALAEGNHFPGDTDGISSREREVVLLEKFCAANMHVDRAVGSLNAHMCADGRNAGFRGVSKNLAHESGLTARIVSYVGLRNRCLLLLCVCEGYGE